MGHGSVTAIVGSMYSGKSTRLLEGVRRADLGRRSFVLVKPQTDDRYASDHVVSHDKSSFPCEVVPNAQEIVHVGAQAERVFIEEGQFFDDELPDIVDLFAGWGRDVTVAGLDLDFRGEPFDIMSRIVMGADHVIKLQAICDVCGEDACRSQRIVDGEPVTHGDVIEVGGVEAYEARCRSCFVYPMSREPTPT